MIYTYISQASDCGTRTSARLDYLYSQQNAFPVPGWFDVAAKFVGGSAGGGSRRVSEQPRVRHNFPEM